MDNITQWIIGWSLYSLITKKASNKTFLLGGLITNIPDFDTFIAGLVTADPIDQQFFHRGIMHSIIFNLGLSLVLWYVLYLSDKSVPYRRYALGCFVSIVAWHLLIDGMTSYGMRYFLPRNKTVYSRDNIFVVDFGMWIITIGGFIWYLWSKAKKKIAQWILGVVWLYFIMSFGIQSYTNTIFKAHYPPEISKETIVQSLTTVEPLQIFLRRHVIKTNEWLYESYYSLFDKDTSLQRRFHKVDAQAQNYVRTIAQQPTKVSTQLNQILNRGRWFSRIVPLSWEHRIENFAMWGLNGWNTWSSRLFNFYLVWSWDHISITRHGDGRNITASVWNDFRKRVFGDTTTRN